MKKILVCALAIAALASCQKNQVLETVVGPAIAFENAAVDNATRAAADPSITTENITEFSVWGFMDEPAGAVFTEETVSKSGAAWTYANTQYWYAGHEYYFAAISPVKNAAITVNTANASELGLGTVSFDNETAKGGVDLIYAAATQVTTANQDLSAMQPVGLTFNHLLSKVKFSFTNGFENPNATLVITDLTMTAPKSGDINLAVKNWWDNDDWKLGAEAVTLDFGDVNGGDKIASGAKTECADERLTIPAGKDYEYAVTFSVQLYNGTVEVFETPRTLTTKVTDAALEMGKAYNFNAEINASNIMGPDEQLYPIEFTVVEVKDWVTATTPDESVQESELKYAAQMGGVYTLTDDVTLTSPMAVNTNFTLNLNGKTITNKVDNTATDVIVVAEGATLTINGEGTVEAVTGNDGYAVIADGTVIINGGTFKSGADADGAANAVVYARGNGKVYVNGGTFPNANNSAYVLNKKDSDRATTTIEVTGGTFTNWNPANNAAEGAGTNFVVEGYKSVEVETGVWEVSVAPVASEVAEGETLKVIVDAPIAGSVAVAGTLDGQGHTLYAEDVPTNNGLIRPAGEATIQNVTIDGKNLSWNDNGTEKGLRAIYITKGGTYTIQNVTVENVTYAINVNTKEDVALNVYNSVLEGWTSYGTSTTAVFNNVTFTAGTYNTFRPYGTATLTNCEFTNMIIDLSELAEGETITFKNCTVNGAAISEANLTSAPTTGVTIE